MAVSKRKAGSMEKEATQRLSLGESIEKWLQGGQSDCVFLELKAEDLVKVRVETADLLSNATVYAPDGTMLRRVSGDGGPIREIYFVARGAGLYRVEIKASEGTTANRFLIRLEKILSLDQRLEPPQSNEIMLLHEFRRDLLIQEPGALEKFWEKADHLGTPIFDAIDADTDSTRCTFLYRGDENTRSVLVSIPPFSRIAKHKFMMRRVEATDVWYTTVELPARSRFLYSLVINAPYLNAGPGSSQEEIEMFRAAAMADPLNPSRMTRWDSENGLEARSIFEPPGATPQLWIERSHKNRLESLKRYSLKSVSLGDERRISVFTPPAYDEQSSPSPLLILFDERVYRKEIQLDVILENLIEEGRIPPLVAVLIDSARGARGRELSCNRRFSDFVAGEMLEWIGRRYNVAQDPGQITLAGASLGGLAAVFTALHHSERFGNVLSQSGSFWWNPPNRVTGGVEPNAIVGFALEEPVKKIRFYLEAGTDEIELPGRGMGVLNANRNLRDVLRAKGYEVLYREFEGGHGALNWRGGIAEGLIALTQKK